MNLPHLTKRVVDAADRYCRALDDMEKQPATFKQTAVAHTLRHLRDAVARRRAAVLAGAVGASDDVD